MPIHDWTRVPAGTFHFFHRGKHSSRRSASGHADLPHAGSLRPLSARSVVPSLVGRLPQGPQGTARNSLEMTNQDFDPLGDIADLSAIFLPEKSC
jgi:hypothetical protein